MPCGLVGNQCANNIPDCLSSPCQNGATCEDGIVNYTCVCTALYEGRHCDSLRPDVPFSAAHLRPGLSPVIAAIGVATFLLLPGRRS